MVSRKGMDSNRASMMTALGLTIVLLKIIECRLKFVESGTFTPTRHQHSQGCGFAKETAEQHLVVSKVEDITTS